MIADMMVTKLLFRPAAAGLKTPDCSCRGFFFLMAPRPSVCWYWPIAARASFSVSITDILLREEILWVSRGNGMAVFRRRLVPPLTLLQGDGRGDNKHVTVGATAAAVW